MSHELRISPDLRLAPVVIGREDVSAIFVGTNENNEDARGNKEVQFSCSETHVSAC